MPLIAAIFSTVLDALFPVPKAEREVLAMNGPSAWSALPRAKEFPIKEACSVFAYKDERVSRLIWAIKYKKSLVGARIAGYALFKVLSLFAAVVPRIVIIPMPVSRTRRRERGYNQCELILDEIERLEKEGLAATRSQNGATETHARLHFSRDLLLRIKNTSRQTLKDRKERLKISDDVFAVNETAAMKIHSVIGNVPETLLIVIDDVVTTGSTILDAIHALRRAGFANTFGLSVAH